MQFWSDSSQHRMRDCTFISKVTELVVLMRMLEMEFFIHVSLADRDGKDRQNVDFWRLKYKTVQIFQNTGDGSTQGYYSGSPDLATQSSFASLPPLPSKTKRRNRFTCHVL